MKKDFQFLLYNSAEENISVNAVIKDETIWLTQKAMAELFGTQVPAISKHLQNIFAEGELEKASEQYEIFNKTQKIESDFDKAVKELLIENIQ